MIEPLDDWDNAIKEHLKYLNGEHCKIALSNREGESNIVVAEGARPGGATILYPHISDGRRQAIELKTLDTLFYNTSPLKPILLKTDCQGSDLLVMKGGRKFLKQVDVIIMEVPMKSIIGNFGQVLAYMNSVEFDVFDIVEPLYSKNGFLAQVDLLFIRKDHLINKLPIW